MKRFLFWGRGVEDPAGDKPEEAEGLITGNPPEDLATLRMLLESIAEVSSGMELDQVLDRIVSRSIQVTDAERAIVFLGESSENLEVRVGRDRQGRALGNDLQFSRSMVARCLQERHPVRSVVRSDQEALELGQSVFDLKLRAVMCAPLEVQDRLIGAIYVDSRAQRREFSGRDLALFGAMSAQIAIAIENARLYADSLEKVRLQKDVELARTIQQHLLIASPERVGSIDCAVHFQACEGTSGDAYDVFDRGERGVVAAIADATGHGIGAALLTHAFHAALRTYLELVDDLGTIANRLNDRVTERSEDGHFLSALLVAVDPRQRVLHYVNAGHPGLLLVRAGDVIPLEEHGIVFGVMAGHRYKVSGPVPLQPGDVLFLRTDGIDEAFGPGQEPFGETRLREVLSRNSGRSAREVVDAVAEAVAEHRAGCPQDDDVTMMALRVPPVGAAT